MPCLKPIEFTDKTYRFERMREDAVFFGKYATDPLALNPVTYFLPDPISTDYELPNYVHAEVAFAQAALGELKGFSAGDPVLVAATRLATLQDALDSSRIEGTQATLGEVLADETNPSGATRDVIEVRNLRLAIDQGFELLRDLPIGVRMMRRLHQTLLDTPASQSKTPGEFRRSFVWIGKPGQTLESAELVPPAHHEIPELLADWERFVNEPKSNIPPVIRNAIAHYQFETIHPFLDGNGRLGRLLALLMLMDDGILTHPVLSISTQIEKNRSAYYKALGAVRTQGDMAGWIEFWATMLKMSATAALGRFERLQILHLKYIREAPNQSTRALVDAIFQNPLATVSTIRTHLGVTQPSALALLRRGVELGWLKPIGESSPGRRQFYIASELWQAITKEPEPTDSRLL
jgi:Fic family protein